MHVLITGGAGFIGSHLADHLIELGHRITVLDNLSTGSLKNIRHLLENEQFQFVNGSVLDEKIVDKFMERCDSVIHLAAAVGVELIIEKPLESMMTNIRGSEVVLEAAHRYNRKALIASTSEIYGKNDRGPLDEETNRVLGSPLKSRWSYSTSKAVDEILAYAYWKEKGLPTVIVRLFNTVGPRQSGSYGMVLPRFVQQALAGEPLLVHGNGNQSRCFLHVKDVVQAITKLVQHPDAVGQVFNLGSQEEITIENLAKRVIEITASDSKIEYVPYEEAYEEGYEDMPKRVPEIRKVKGLIDFEPSYSLEDIIRSVIDYTLADQKAQANILGKKTPTAKATT